MTFLFFFPWHLEFLEVVAAFLPGRSHDVQEVWREHKGNPLLTDSHETLVIAQDVAKVDVEEISCRNTQRRQTCLVSNGKYTRGREFRFQFLDEPWDSGYLFCGAVIVCNRTL